MFEKNIPETGGGPPFLGNFENCQKCQKYVSRAPPGGAGRHFSDILDSGRADPGCRGGGRGGVPPLAAQTDVNPVLRIYRPVQEHYGSSHTHTN